MNNRKTVIEYLREVYIHESNASRSRKKATDIFNIVRRMIESGETTEDPLRDYIIVAMEIISEELVALLQKIEKEVRERKDELLLLIHTYQEDSVKYATGHRKSIIHSRMITVKRLYLGILNGTTLVVNPQEKLCDFPLDTIVASSKAHEVFFDKKTPGSMAIKSILIQESTQTKINEFFTLWDFKIGIGNIVSWMIENPLYVKHVTDMSHELGYASELEVAFKLAR